jgi:hypothetical protein
MSILPRCKESKLQLNLLDFKLVKARLLEGEDLGTITLDSEYSSFAGASLAKLLGGRSEMN